MSEAKRKNKRGIVAIILILLVLIVVALFFLLRDDKADQLIAEEFLTQYYTAAQDEENVFNKMSEIRSAYALDPAQFEIETENMLNEAYGSLLTIDEMQRLVANRKLTAPDQLAEESELSLSCQEIVLTKKTDMKQEKHYYDFMVTVHIENASEDFTDLTIEGIIVLEETDDVWKVSDFYPMQDIRTILLKFRSPETTE